MHSKVETYSAFVGDDEYIVSGDKKSGWAVTKLPEGRIKQLVTYNVVKSRDGWRCDCRYGYRQGLMKTIDEFCRHIPLVVQYEEAGGIVAVRDDIFSSINDLLQRSKEFLNDGGQ